MKSVYILSCMLLTVVFISCSSGQKKVMTQRQPIQEELSKLNTLLRDSALAVNIAAAQDAAYHTALEKTVPAFDADKHTMIKKSIRDEKIATSIAAFYALECGIGALVEQKGNSPVYWLTKIINKQLTPPEILLLNRFANATWKAGQPFRSLSRITRDNFVVAAFLSDEETKKDQDQVTAAAIKLLAALKEVTGRSNDEQFKKISQLMKDKAFAFEMAMHLEAAYYSAVKQPVPLFISPGDDTAMTAKNTFEEKVATSIAGFYALECGLTYFASSQNKLPSQVLQTIIEGSISKTDKRLLERFANATWKAGQPFRNIDRITRDNFTPFYFLSEEEIEKDWVQITTMAKQLSKLL